MNWNWLWRGRWVHPDVKWAVEETLSIIFGIGGAALLVQLITGIYYLCEWLKTVS
jgi:hypothetical protein